MKRLILASASQRRRELLHNITDNFEIIVAGVDERTDLTNPIDLVRELAKRKAEAVFKDNTDATVIGADTVVCIDSIVLGKPKDSFEAEKYIRMLEGNAHKVYTGVCVMSEGVCDVRHAVTEVLFDHMTDIQIEKYILAGDYADKAGAYAIQGEAAKYINSINGCYYNVVGLPLSVLRSMLEAVR